MRVDVFRGWIRTLKSFFFSLFFLSLEPILFVYFVDRKALWYLCDYSKVYEIDVVDKRAKMKMRGSVKTKSVASEWYGH